MTKLPDSKDLSGQTLNHSFEEVRHFGKTTAIETESYSQGHGIFVSYNAESTSIVVADKYDGSFSSGEIVIRAEEFFSKLDIQPEVLEAAAKKKILSVAAIKLVLEAADDLAQEWMEQESAGMTDVLQGKLAALMNAVLDARSTGY